MKPEKQQPAKKRGRKPGRLRRKKRRQIQSQKRTRSQKNEQYLHEERALRALHRGKSSAYHKVRKDAIANEESEEVENLLCVKQ